MNITEQAKQFLAESGWTQEQLALAIGVHITSLNRYLNQSKRKATPERLVEFLRSEEAALAMSIKKDMPQE